MVVFDMTGGHGRYWTGLEVLIVIRQDWRPWLSSDRTGDHGHHWTGGKEGHASVDMLEGKFKGIVQRKLRGVELYINQLVFEIKDKRFRFI